MDASRFDILTRSLTDSVSRRTIGGLSLGGILGLLDLGKGAAKKRKNKNKRKTRRCKCRPCTRCRKGKCKDLQPAGTSCGAGRQCIANGTCSITCGAVVECPAGCTCGDSADNTELCSADDQGAGECARLACATSADCPLGQQCQKWLCNGSFTTRCFAVCAP
jgi:hypothetical protein